MEGSNLILAALMALTVLLGGGFVGLVRIQRGRRPTALALLVGNALLLGCLASVAIAAGEVYYRFVYDASDDWDLGPVTQRWLRRHYRYNNLGVRDDTDYAPRIGPGRRRISVLGDSFSNGHGLSDVGQRFVNRLRRDHREWEVHLVGGDGLDTGALAERLARWLDAGYEIDVVLYAYCLNDVSDLSREWQQAASRVYDARPGWLVRNSFAINTYHYRLAALFDRDLRDYFDFVARAYDERWPEQQRRLTALQALVGAHGGQLVVATFPFFERMDSPSYRTIHRRLDAFWAAQGVPHLDLLPVYLDPPREALVVSRHDAHPSALAHALAAERLGPFLGGVLVAGTAPEATSQGGADE